VLAVVHLHAVDGERRRLATGYAHAFEDLDVRAGLLQSHGSAQPGEARSDDGDARTPYGHTACNQARAMTASLVAFESDARRCSGSNGSASMRSRIRR
jgi:hypothetical protein